LPYYIRSLPIIIQQYSDFIAFLIVPKDERPDLIQGIVSLIDDLQLNDHVIWIEPVVYETLKHYIMMSDLVVLPTLSE
jgi:glycosyltransferase involved in cell wall biosynthesis